MDMRKAVWAALAGGVFALGSGGAQASVAPLCADIHTIGDWATAGECTQADKLWIYTSSNLDASVLVIFTGAATEHNLQIAGFDNSAAAGAWDIKYSISVTTAGNTISDMFAGADNPVPTSLLTKTVTGDPGGPFVLTDTNGAEGPTAEKHGLTATSLDIDEAFSVGAGGVLNSVSNTYFEHTPAPEPGTLMLLGAGLIGLGALRRRKSS